MIRTLATYAFFVLACSALANNIQISNSTLVDDAPADGFCKVRFDISWENSWRVSTAPNNWDAAWVFVKYRDINTGLWHHARLGGDANHSAPTGSTISTGLLTPGSPFNVNTNWGVGVFIHRSANGTGTFNATGVELRWNYAANGINYGTIDEVKVFGVEMVYVPEGAFAAGSGGTEPIGFTLTTINTANATTAPSGVGSLGGQAGGFPSGQTAPANASWPNGFNAFYSMKYEVSQQGYVDFLNTLTRTQQNTRTGTDISGTSITNRYVMSNTSTLNFRNGIRCNATIPASPAPATFYCDLSGNGIGGEASDGKEIACNYVSWGDLTAYLDWSGLRPMTELEFEKACRGTIAPVANEYPWGTSGISGSAYTLANAGATNEGIATDYSTTLGNAVYTTTNGTPSGPKRVGIFAANGSNSGRVTAGASYYGIMELGGNLWERAVTIGNVEGRAYTGLHGNGALAADGNPDATAWPAPTTALGAGFRGGSWIDFASFMQVSDRNFAANTFSVRVNFDSGRGARSAP